MRYTPFVALAALVLIVGQARADGTSAPVTWGGRAVSPSEAPAATESPVVRARELLSRAKFLDDAGAADDKASVDTQQRLPGLRASAKAARERASRATGNAQELLAAVAEHLEADVIVSEAETVAKRRQAVENRRVARELREKAVKLVREAPTDDPPEKPRVTSNAATPEASAPDGDDKPKTGFLTLDTYPWCRVSLAGRVIGDTPIIHLQLPVGTHVLVLESPTENLSKTTVVTIKPGETASKRLAF